ncbi:bifunctional 2-polyprenyl-6-hydroxyphenol methylase/3-demethylubiquinol 3-O-methyltransferase UbiG [Volucribacter amazonae]|uniref:2-polyprenyl-6-hydroxyphenol methylase n=1 Tax=Volucribacter amazonae TaxID=256731 RepID=A0A9X4SJQ5_9PAST|nr:bifunctional 2-polyprenyl-6-hydroxyphenol methylase/3-demethylubiquinol 3-O-methyltransferase UbiG [Volucribacter amazonae]MDG6894374.1 hypothetical protein [Volucribacter amazonae]
MVNTSDKFAQQAQHWWDPNGISKPLHRLTPWRLAYIMQQNQGIVDKQILDLGCGGGILTQALAQQGAKVTGIDIACPLLHIAKQQARQQGLQIDYHCIDIAQYSPDKRFDCILCLDVLQHIHKPESLLHHCQRLLKPNGKLIITTINRSVMAWIVMILLAEKMLKLLPQGTHHYAQFIKPTTLIKFAKNMGFTLADLQGYRYNPCTEKAYFISHCQVNYVATFMAQDL